MIKIVFYINNITKSAGTERATVNLANSFIKFGFQASIVSVFSKDGGSYFELDNRVNVVHMGYHMSTNPVLRILRLPSIFLRIMMSSKISEGAFLIGTNHLLNILLAVRALVNNKYKYIGCEHLSYGAAKPITKKVRGFFYRYLDGLVVLTQDDLLKYTEFDNIKNCYVIPNQVSFNSDSAAECEKKIILAVGRLSYQKGYDLMIEAVASVLKRHTDWKLVIVGDGEFKNDLIKKIHECNVYEQVVIKPFSKKIIDYYLDSSIYIMTSRYEGFPMVLLEAKVCGLPIVAYDCLTGPAYLIEENDGFLIPMNNVELFSSKLELLMQNKKLRKTMGKNARKNIKKYSEEDIFLKWEALLDII